VRVVWEAYSVRVPLLWVPEHAIDLFYIVISQFYLGIPILIGTKLVLLQIDSMFSPTCPDKQRAAVKQVTFENVGFSTVRSTGLGFHHHRFH
jgi:hypothetical protein